MSILSKIFRPKIGFQPIDPLGDGLREMIRQEQTSEGAFDLQEDVSEIDNFWNRVSHDLRDEAK